MVIERIIYFYNPYSREKLIEKEKLMGNYEEEEEDYKQEDLGDLIAIKEEEEDLKTKPHQYSLANLNEKPPNSDVEHKIRAKKLWKEKIFKYPVFYKFVLQIFHLILFSYFVFVYMSTNGTNVFTKKTMWNNDKKIFLSYYVHPNKFLMIFFLIYCIYLTLSAYQIK